ncbi:MAG: Holliday junction branch migration protein RuvA [Actinomycetota bacterium]
MIASLSGTVLSKDAHSAIIEVSGVGFRILASSATLAQLTVGEKAVMKTSLVVREDSMTLFGFGNSEELSTFDLLCSVSGVGPKSALAILSQLSVSDITKAVSAEDDSAFRTVSGIGSKTAKLIILSLAGKLITSSATDASSRTVLALVGLGWSEKASRSAVSEVISEDLDEGQILRAALQRLSAKADEK